MRIQRRARLGRMPSMALLMTAWAVTGSALAAGADEPEATPYRPSVSTPAALSAPGWIEIEAGIARDLQGSVRLDSVPATIKLAFTPDWGVRIGGDAWQRRRDGSSRSSGVGDVDVVLKRRFAWDESQAFGLEAAATLPTAHGDAGVRKAAWGVNAIYSADVGAWHADLNFAGTRLGAPDPGASRLVVLWAAALSRPLDAQWGLVGELSGTRQTGAQPSSQALVAATYALSRRLVLDVGAARGLRSGPVTWSAFGGFTWTAARLF